jgi:para-aminobenzoate synthetase component 1
MQLIYKIAVAFFLQIYTVKRSWKRVHIEHNGQLLRLLLHYNVAAACTGEGWKHGKRIALGAVRSTNDYVGSFLSRTAQFTAENSDYIFGHAGYNLKSETEGIDCAFPNEDGFDAGYYFVPEIVIEQRNSEWWAGCFSENDLLRLEHLLRENSNAAPTSEIQLLPVTDAALYSKQCNSLLSHIRRGDIYEINYCIDFIGKSNAVNPIEVFLRLQELSEAPLSVLYRNHNAWLLCASPERFIAKSGTTLQSQPIKGTIRRGNTTAEDEALRTQLYNDPKERSENVMIVDLVRNDLSRIATPASVHVPELFGIHTFKTVHQMISTVECEVDAALSFSEILKATFPMGSMTGAPKISALKLAEKHEAQSRGIYSGSVGYILPNGDFDFNVVIRSITWNAATGHVSAKAGSAITAKSVPEKEYAECLLKAKAMMRALNPASPV